MSEYVLQTHDKDVSVLSPVELSLTNFDNLVCFDCETHKTPLWRRGLKGEYLCNACGLYWKVHGTHRPLSLKSSIIKHRNRQRKDAQPTSKKSHSASIKRSISSSQPKGSTRKAMIVSPKSPSSLSSSSSSSLSSSSSSLPLSPRLSESNHILLSSPELSTKKIRRVAMNNPEPLQSKVALLSTSTVVSASLDNLQSKIALPRSASPAALISELNTVHHHGLRIKLGDFVIIRNEDDPQSSLYGCIRKFMVSKGQTFFFVTWLLPRPGIVIDWRECSPADFIWGPEEALPKAISLIVRLLPLVVDLSSDRESSAESTSSDEERNNLCERSFFATTLKPVLPSFRTGFKFVDAETTLQRTRSSTASNESSFSANDISAATMLFDLSIHRTPNQQNVIF